MEQKITCLVTLHGVGFQQPPQPGDPEPNSGYADLLHKHLQQFLPENTLSDDPERRHDRPHDNGPIYVASYWRDEGSRVNGHENILSRENGLRRLDGRLVANHEPVSHIALVYSDLEEPSSKKHRGYWSLVTFGMFCFSLRHYTTILGLTRLMLANILAIRLGSAHERGRANPRPRTDWNMQSPFAQSLRRHRSMILAFKDDVAGYVCEGILL